MRIPSRLNPSARGQVIGFLALIVLPMLLMGGGCEDKHIGRPCLLGATVDAGSGTAATTTITSPALECPSRICILPGAEKTTTTGPLCTDTCSSDSDCSDGETGTSSELCKTGFACMWPTTVGPFCCQKFCVCRDFVSEPMGGFTIPQVCTSSAGGCQNVH